MSMCNFVKMIIFRYKIEAHGTIVIFDCGRTRKCRLAQSEMHWYSRECRITPEVHVYHVPPPKSQNFYHATAEPSFTSSSSHSSNFTHFRYTARTLSFWKVKATCRELIDQESSRNVPRRSTECVRAVQDPPPLLALHSRRP